MARLALLLSFVLALPAQAKPLATLKGHKGTVAAVAFSPNGKLLASGAWDRQIRLWDVSTGKLVGELKGHRDWIRALRFQDNKTLVSACERDIRTWDVTKKTGVLSYALPRKLITSMAFDFSGNRLILGSRNGHVWIWTRGSKKPYERKVHPVAVTAVALQNKGDRYAAGASRGQLLLGSTKSTALVKLSGHDGSKIFVLAFSPDDKSLASGAFDTTIKIWTLPSGSNKTILRGHTSLIQSLLYSRSGTLLSGDRRGNVYIWNFGTGKPEKSITAHPGPSGFSVLGLDVSRDGKRIATGAYDHLVKLWQR